MVLRRIYSKLFPSPNEKTQDGKFVGIERRRELCQKLGSTALGPISQAAYDDVNALLSAHAGESLVLDFNTQLVPLRMAFVEATYSAVRNVQDSRPNIPRTLKGARVLDVGPVELQFVYHALLSHLDEKSPAGTEAHALLKQLKWAAIFEQDTEIRKTLQAAYDSNLLQAPDNGRQLGVTLIWSDDFIKQIQSLVAGNALVKIEPYGEGRLVSCLVDGGARRVRLNCY
ncbi:hypothetical protein MFUL124B02_42525 [Myxococcus fulvus 124B02]|nr:hypothetical protein MFUL124B02_42525 [Myxococcus fulvus 124B02]